MDVLAEYLSEQAALYQADCIDVLWNGLPENSVGLTVTSPPFSSLYTYSASNRDLGNCANWDEFHDHFAFLATSLQRVTMPGRLACIHVAQTPAMLARDGYIGLKDFRGGVIELFGSTGWVYHGDVCIDKDPQAQAIRTHAKALLFNQLHKDASWLRPALADYILVFRKPGANAVPILPDLTNEEWIEWARPVWYGIKETDTLQYTVARGGEDERHIAPLQLGVIERCVRLWSNKGEVVLDPFAGIGSTPYTAIKQGRLGVGVELKSEYWEVARRNLGDAERTVMTPDLFSLSGVAI
jgi:DNA modification methylase